MLTKDRLFPSQIKGERVFLLIRKHWFVYVTFGFVFILMTIPVIAVMIYWFWNYLTISTLAGSIIIAGTSVYLLFMLGVQLYGFVDYYLDVDIVTDRRLIDIDQNGLFKRKISELYLHQVQDVEAKVEGIAATLFHFGDVHIQTAGERENFIFRSIPHPYTVAKQIVNLHEQQYQQELMIRTDGRRKLPEKNLSFGELESQAKEILKSLPFSKRISNPGIFPAPDIQMPGDFQRDDSSMKDDENKIFRKNEINPSDVLPADFKQSETNQNKIRPKTTRRKLVKKKETANVKTEIKQPNDTHLSEEGELKEGREVDLKD